MPQSALEQLSRLHILYPMMFMIGDERRTRSTHCGVLEFCAPEGIVYMPGWMIKTLNIRAGSLITVLNTSLPLGKYSKLNMPFIFLSADTSRFSRNHQTFSTSPTRVQSWSTPSGNLLRYLERPHPDLLQP